MQLCRKHSSTMHVLLSKRRSVDFCPQCFSKLEQKRVHPEKCLFLACPAQLGECLAAGCLSETCLSEGHMFCVYQIVKLNAGQPWQTGSWGTENRPTTTGSAVPCSTSAEQTSQSVRNKLRQKAYMPPAALNNVYEQNNPGTTNVMGLSLK